MTAIRRDRDSVLQKKILFLGSSVTYGSAAKGTSFVDYLERRQEILPYKYALSGTTLPKLAFGSPCQGNAHTGESVMLVA